MSRRIFLRRAGQFAGYAWLLPALLRATAARANPTRRTRPVDTAWPRTEAWAQLNSEVGGQLIKVEPPFAACARDPAACGEVFRRMKNPYAIGDNVALTQSLGWVGAWTSQPSAYAIAARRTADVSAAVNFARAHNLRLVVKGGGHSYHGTSNAPDSLLIWTRPMNAITLHEGFVAQGCASTQAPIPAVTIEAGAIWMHSYDTAAKAGRYVQGGGCATVGVAGLILSGGFGSFSKRYGLACASLLEAEIVTADGVARIANACTHPDLFWALKGGGGGSLGVVTRLTLRTHDLPDFFGAVFATIRASTDDAYRRLIARVMRFYADALFNPHWGEQLTFRRDNLLQIKMVFQGLTQAEAEAIWRPFFDWVRAAPQDYNFPSAPQTLAVPARQFWDPATLMGVPGVVLSDDRPGAPAGNIFWAGDVNEAGQVLHGYQSAWMPAALLRVDQQPRLVDALFVASRHWGVSLHMNKGLAGAPASAIEAARDTAMNPAVLTAFALAISGAQQQPAYPGIVGHEPDTPAAQRNARAVANVMGDLRRLAGAHGSYVSESDFFGDDWPQSYWGANHARLAAIKAKYDPDGLFFVHHGVGSERWSADGFTRER